ncbi:type I-E CRISPR-associated protein Cse1/CasA [Catenulispora rubra]|uniref:type I-E CRISPR-associated protein Cse1/CasA n=1 Tax=Catenulispora rubra TaxID=280293 RepID=UPI001892226B|nr:type I-E CRISPR-associated protein Cse1/CasA [Catenulispora rubra]
MEFSLVDEPWIPVLRGGERVRVGIRQALLEARSITDLAPDAPIQEPAILRQVLLPVVWAALGPCRDDDEWAVRFGQDGFTASEQLRIEAYLTAHRPRFDLFSADTPFAQTPGLRALNGRTKSVALLMADVPSGNNVPLFAAATEATRVELTPAQAACWLVSTQCWDTAAIKTGAVGDEKAKGGKTTGNHTGPLGRLGLAYPAGLDLYQTLVLNSPVLASDFVDDAPAWELPPPDAGWGTRPVNGILDLVTWPARRIRLFPEASGDGVRVARVVVAAGDRMKEVPDFEPHTLWRHGAGAKARRPRWHRPGQPAWEGMAALLAVGGADGTSGTHGTRDETHADNAPAHTDSARTRDDSPPARGSSPPPPDTSPHPRGDSAPAGIDSAGTRDATARARDGFTTSSLLTQLARLHAHGAVAADYPLRVRTVAVAYGVQSAIIEDVAADQISIPVAALAPDGRARVHLLEVAEQAERLARATDRLAADLRRASGGEPVPWENGEHAGERLLYELDPLVRRVLTGLQHHTADQQSVSVGIATWQQAARATTLRVGTQLLHATPPRTFGGREVGGRRYRGATAEAAFRREINRTLPLAAPSAAAPEVSVGVSVSVSVSLSVSAGAGQGAV